MNMLNTAAKLDWSGWARGVIGAFISGGSAAIAAGTAVSAVDPSHDIAGWLMVKVMGVTFLVAGVISLAKFLETHPVPDPAPKS